MRARINGKPIHSSARQSNGSDYSLALRCMHADGFSFPLARQ